MFHIGLQTRDIVTFENYQLSTKNKTKQNKTRRVQFQINRFKAYQHLPTINKSNGVFVIEIKDKYKNSNNCQLTDLIQNILKAWEIAIF